MKKIILITAILTMTTLSGCLERENPLTKTDMSTLTSWVTQPITGDTLPENSIVSFQTAIEFGADGLEFDVHLTKDSEIAVIHDDQLNKKLASVDRHTTELGLVSNYTLTELKRMDIGNGHTIPSLTDVLDLFIVASARYEAATGHRLMIDIELKGEHTAQATYNTIKPYIEMGYLKAEDFVFNSFNWDNLQEIRALDSRFKLIPAIKTVDLFGDSNVTMPGWKVKKDAGYQPQSLTRLQELHNAINCYAFDCIVFDLRPEFVDFCAKNNIGLFTSTGSDLTRVDQLKEQLTLMVRAEEYLPVVCFRADNVSEPRELIHILIKEQSKPQKKTSQAINGSQMTNRIIFNPDSLENVK